MIRTILFDLDETLYPRGVGIMNQIRLLILEYVCNRLGLPEPEADTLRQVYLRDYGTTMRGLQLNHQIDTDDYLDYVHKIQLDRYLEANPELDAALATLPQEKVVFTNASREHAEAVLAVLGVGHHFARIVDVRDMGFESKPQPSAYQRICQMLGCLPEECVLVEDNVRNLLPAKALGMVTILVGENGVQAGGGIDYVISRVEEIGEVLARITR